MNENEEIIFYKRKTTEAQQLNRAENIKSSQEV